MIVIKPSDRFDVECSRSGYVTHEPHEGGEYVLADNHILEVQQYKDEIQRLTDLATSLQDEVNNMQYRLDGLEK